MRRTWRVLGSVLVLAIAVVAGMRLSRSNNKPVDSARVKKHVEILKFVSHPALDATEAGVLEQLRADFGAGLSVVTHNAQGNPTLAKSLAEAAVAAQPDVIIAIATPAAQAVARTPRSVPLVYGAVADPEGAGILASGNVTGIRNVAPHIIETALRFLRATFPNAKRLGTMFNPAEQNSVAVQGLIDKLAPKYGFTYVPLSIRSSSQVPSAAESLTRQVDVIYSANDNTVNSAAAGVAGVAVATKTPFVLGDLATLSKGAFAAIGLDYAPMGRRVGELASRILRGESVSAIAPQDAPPAEVWVNEPVRRAIGVELPATSRKMVNRLVEP